MDYGRIDKKIINFIGESCFLQRYMIREDCKQKLKLFSKKSRCFKLGSVDR